MSERLSHAARAAAHRSYPDDDAAALLALAHCPLNVSPHRPAANPGGNTAHAEQNIPNAQAKAHYR